jgi:nitrogen fixation NifU-like protein
MELKALYREIVNEHNLHPSHKKKLGGATMTLEGVNPSCGDDIELQLLIKDGVIEDAAFNGSGCAISQASCDMMCDRIIGEKEEDALALAQNFMGMIKGTATDEQIETLDESAALKDISHMPARVKCAVLGWRTMSEMVEKLNAEGVDTASATAQNSDACGVCATNSAAVCKPDCQGCCSEPSKKDPEGKA